MGISLPLELTYTLTSMGIREILHKSTYIFIICLRHTIYRAEHAVHHTHETHYYVWNILHRDNTNYNELSLHTGTFI